MKNHLVTYYMWNKRERQEWETKVFWLKVVGDTLVKIGIDTGVSQKSGNVHLKLQREDLGAIFVGINKLFSLISLMRALKIVLFVLEIEIYRWILLQKKYMSWI